MPTLTQLEYMLAVDRTRHFAKAAKECHVTQPTLSQQLQKLEAEIETIIFDRTKKPILPTEKGERIIEQARKVLREHKKLIEIGQEDPNQLKGEFKLAVIPTLSPYLIPLFINSFSQEYPGIKLSIYEDQTEDIIEKLENDKIDAALMATPLRNSQLIERTLFFETFYAYLSSEHPFQKKKRISQADLKGNDIWILDEGHCLREQTMRICSLSKQPQVLSNVHFQSGNLETLKQIVRRGQGMTLLPHLATQGLSEEDQQRLRPFAKPRPTREISLVHTRIFLKEPIILALEKTILNSLPPELKSFKKQDYEIVDF